MLFFTFDHVYAVEAPSIGDCCFTNQARGLESFPDIFVGWSLFLWALNYKPGADREKNTDVGFRTEWPYRGTCRTFPFWIIPHRLSAKTARGECAWRGLMKACPLYWHVVVYDCECVRVCVRERVQEGVCRCLRAHQFVQCVCIDVWMTACVWEAYCKHAAPDSSVRATIVCMTVCVLCARARVYACLCLSVRVCVSVYVHIISLTILLQYFYTSGRTVSCIIVSLNLEKSNVYLIVLFFVAEKTVEKMYNKHYQTLIF